MDSLDGFCVRWMIRRDLPEVLQIEYDSFDAPRTHDDFTRVLSLRNTMGWVVEFDHTIVAFMVVELGRYNLRILDFAVHIDYRRRGVGATLASKLIGKLSPNRRRSIVCLVPESYLDGQLFFKAMGFRAVRVEHGHYRMIYALPWSAFEESLRSPAASDYDTSRVMT